MQSAGTYTLQKNASNLTLSSPPHRRLRSSSTSWLNSLSLRVGPRTCYLTMSKKTSSAQKNSSSPSLKRQIPWIKSATIWLNNTTWLRELEGWYMEKTSWREHRKNKIYLKIIETAQMSWSQNSDRKGVSRVLIEAIIFYSTVGNAIIERGEGSFR